MNKNKSQTIAYPKNDILGAILQEVRLLREEVGLLLPNENLKDYAHPARIKRSYQKAIKQYPPAAI